MFKKRHGPASIKNYFGGKIISRLKAVPSFGRFPIQRDELIFCATFQAVRPLCLIGDIVLKRSQEEGSEFALQPVHLGQRAMFQQMKEKSLSIILCVISGIAATAGKRINRIPIYPAKLCQRGLCSFFLALSRTQHQSPARGVKLWRTGWICGRNFPRHYRGLVYRKSAVPETKTHA